VDPAPHKRPRIVVWWEELSIVLQIAVVAPISIIGISWLHILLFVPNISVERAIGYGFFWGAIVTFALVGATRAERARRLADQAAARKATSDDDTTSS
jgi:multidrug efflux pump subunit AcrB